MGGTVVARDRVIDNGIVLVEDGLIRFVGRREDAAPEPGSMVLNTENGMVIPGLIDTHVHGSDGFDVMVDGIEGIRTISQAQLRYATTAYLPTTVSSDHCQLLQALEACVQAKCNHNPAAEILGVHVEGPFINKTKKGAQPDRSIRDPDLAECREYLHAARGMVKIMTLAPELPGGFELIRLLRANGVVASLGHSDADYETAMAAVEAGATHATHLFNAMPAIHHRRGGLALACLNDSRIQAEIIVDGLHVSWEMVKLAVKAKGNRGLLLITDGISAVGCPDGNYRIGDSLVDLANEHCTLHGTTTIAGSVLTMNRAIRNAIAYAGMTLLDAVNFGSYIPACLCGVSERKGSLEAGKDADIAVLDREFSVSCTLCRGEIVYRSSRAD